MKSDPAGIDALIHLIDWVHDAGVTACFFSGDDNPCSNPTHWHCSLDQLRAAALERHPRQENNEHEPNVQCPKCGFPGGLRPVMGTRLWYCELCQNDSTLQQIVKRERHPPPEKE